MQSFCPNVSNLEPIDQLSTHTSDIVRQNRNVPCQLIAGKGVLTSCIQYVGYWRKDSLFDWLQSQSHYDKKDESSVEDACDNLFIL